MALGALRATGLTIRGLWFLAAGGALMALGWFGALAPAFMFGTLLALLPVLAGLLTRPRAGDPALVRTLAVREVPAGASVSVTLRAREGLGRSILLEDVAGSALGGSHRLVLSGAGRRSGATPTATYRLTTHRRGEHRLGPLRVHDVDTFGLVHRVREVGVIDTVLVHPRVIPLPAAVLGGSALASGSSQHGMPGSASDDLVPRTYRPGDEVRRLDWKATARTGELMVRSEETQRQAALSIVVDLADAHHWGREPGSSLDALLDVAASVGVSALAGGWDVEIRSASDTLLFSGSPGAGVRAERLELLRALATAPVDDVALPGPTLAHNVAATGPVLLICGEGSAAWADLMTVIAPHSPRRMALVLAARQWATTQPAVAPADGMPLPARELAGLFRAAGWRVTRLEHDTPVAQAWAELGMP